MSENRSPEEILARRLDLALPPGSDRVPAGQTPDPLVNAATLIASAPWPELTHDAEARIEAQVLAAFDRVYAAPRRRARAARPVPIRWALRLAQAAAALVLVAALLIIGAVPAAAGSVPGEPLYGLKLAFESVELSFAASDAARASVYLEHAARRAAEAQTLLNRGQFDPGVLQNAADNLTRAVEQAGQAAAEDFFARAEALQRLIVDLSDEFEARGLGDVPPLVLPPPFVTATQEVIASPTPTFTPTTSPTATPSPTVTPSPTEPPTSTPTPTPFVFPGLSEMDEMNELWLPYGIVHTPPAWGLTRTPPALGLTRTPPGPPECPGNSCESQGVPGGRVVPRTPPVPPGQGNPGGGQGQGQGRGRGG